MSEELDAECEGYRAAKDKIPPVNCPYFFRRFKLSQQEFDEQKRHLMNAWFKGYKKYSEQKALP